MADENVEVWSGGVNTWECDEMGHMNTRFYVARCMEALTMLFGLAGLPGLFAPQATTTLAISDMHIRFLREARAAVSMHIMAGFTEISPDRASILAMMHDSATGECAATFRIGVRHIETASRQPAPWPAKFIASVSRELVAVPRLATPRGVGALPSRTSASHTRADTLGLRQLGQGAVLANACDSFQRMLPHAFVGAIADSVRNIITPLRELAASHSDRRGPHFGAAALEFLILLDDMPASGDCWEVRTGLVGADSRTMSIVNWMLDPFSDRAFGSMEVIAICFDLEARKLIPISPPALAEMQEWAIPSLTL